MPSYQFKDQESKSFEVKPAGDYVVRVVGVEFGISKGNKTRGSDNMELKLAVENPNGSLSGCEFYEHLIFHPSCDWKIDIAVKALNLLIGGKPPAKGDPIDFSEHMLCGLRGWATVGVEEYTRNDGTKGKKNTIAAWIANKPKLPKFVELSTDDPGTPANPDDVSFT